MRTFQIYGRAHGQCGRYHVTNGILLRGETAEGAANKIGGTVHPEDTETAIGDSVRIIVRDFAAFARAYVAAQVRATVPGSPELEADEHDVAVMLKENAPFRIVACGVIE